MKGNDLMSKTSKFLAVALLITLLVLFGFLSISRNEVKIDIPNVSFSIKFISDLYGSFSQKIFQR